MSTTDEWPKCPCCGAHHPPNYPKNLVSTIDTFEIPLSDGNTVKIPRKMSMKDYQKLVRTLMIWGECGDLDPEFRKRTDAMSAERFRKDLMEGATCPHTFATIQNIMTSSGKVHERGTRGTPTLCGARMNHYQNTFTPVTCQRCIACKNSPQTTKP